MDGHCKVIIKIMGLIHPKYKSKELLYIHMWLCNTYGLKKVL